MTPALRWEEMRAILMFHNCEGQSHKTVSTHHNIWRERRAKAESNRGLSTYQPNALLKVLMVPTSAYKYLQIEFDK